MLLRCGICNLGLPLGIICYDMFTSVCTLFSEGSVIVPMQAQINLSGEALMLCTELDKPFIDFGYNDGCRRQ